LKKRPPAGFNRREVFSLFRPSTPCRLARYFLRPVSINRYIISDENIAPAGKAGGIRAQPLRGFAGKAGTDVFNRYADSPARPELTCSTATRIRSGNKSGPSMLGPYNPLS